VKNARAPQLRRLPLPVVVEVQLRLQRKLHRLSLRRRLSQRAADGALSRLRRLQSKQ
jgi:hypothetical protein